MNIIEAINKAKKESERLGTVQNILKIEDIIRGLNEFSCIKVSSKEGSIQIEANSDFLDGNDWILENDLISRLREIKYQNI